MEEAGREVTKVGTDYQRNEHRVFIAMGVEGPMLYCYTCGMHKERELAVKRLINAINASGEHHERDIALIDAVWGNK